MKVPADLAKCLAWQDLGRNGLMVDPASKRYMGRFGYGTHLRILVSRCREFIVSLFQYGTHPGHR